jgi:hypothetical protein
VIEFRQLWEDLREAMRLPAATVDLMLRETKGNDPFYERMTRAFYAETRRRHRKFPLLRHWRYGVALCRLPATFDEYIGAIEAAGRRNCKKALRLGYRVERIRHNDHLDGIRAIHASTEVRQGEMPDELVHGEVKPCSDPPTRTTVHDYPYFGVLQGDKLVAYSGCFVCGEIFMIEQLYGHAAHHADGVVPLLLTEMARYAMTHYPRVKFYANEMYFGAGETMRRFKRKFCFEPYKVTWLLGGD